MLQGDMKSPNIMLERVPSSSELVRGEKQMVWTNFELDLMDKSNINILVLQIMCEDLGLLPEYLHHFFIDMG